MLLEVLHHLESLSGEGDENHDYAHARNEEDQSCLVLALLLCCGGFLLLALSV